MEIVQQAFLTIGCSVRTAPNTFHFIWAKTSIAILIPIEAEWVECCCVWKEREAPCHQVLPLYSRSRATQKGTATDTIWEFATIAYPPNYLIQGFRQTLTFYKCSYSVRLQVAKGTRSVPPHHNCPWDRHNLCPLQYPEYPD